MKPWCSKSQIYSYSLLPFPCHTSVSIQYSGSYRLSPCYHTHLHFYCTLIKFLLGKIFCALLSLIQLNTTPENFLSYFAFYGSRQGERWAYFLRFISNINNNLLSFDLRFLKAIGSYSLHFLQTLQVRLALFWRWRDGKVGKLSVWPRVFRRKRD